MDPLLRYRPLFPVLERTLYMISHSLGAMPERTREYLAAYAETWATRSIRAWEEGWWQMPLEVGNLIGRIIGAPPGSVVMQPNVSVSQWIVHSCFDWRGPRNRLVTEGMNFPSNLYIFEELTRQGAEVVKVPSRDGIGIETEDLLNAIDERTRLVSMSHVLFRSAFVQDVMPVVRKAHAAGALVMVDLYQSAGCMPVDVTAMGVDFATGGSVKWLCGGPGAGYLYVKPELVKTLRPACTGWMAHEAPFAFEDSPIRYAPDEFRFLHGTPAIPALYAARAGYETVLEAGLSGIRAKSIRQTQRMIDLADEAGIAVRSPREASKRGGAIVLDVGEGAEVTRQLLREDVLVDYRPGAGIRVAPHFYSTDEECVEVIRRIVSYSSEKTVRSTVAH